VSTEAQPICLQHDFVAHGFHWRRGERFQYRVWAALKLISATSARLYFETTS
jgi:hypothetical protein